MKVIDTHIEGVKIIEPDVFKDSRGYFCETYNAARYKTAGITADFVQDNESFSMKGVVRGLHWQAAPHTQSKLVRVIRGAAWDVAVDIRKDSPTFGQYISCYLFAPDSQFAAQLQRGDNSIVQPSTSTCHAEALRRRNLQPFRQFYLPKGFAHGFVVLEDNTLFSYKCDDFYCKESERGLMFNDPALNIDWPPLDMPIRLSEKDQHHPPLSAIEPWSSPATPPSSSRRGN